MTPRSRSPNSCTSSTTSTNRAPSAVASVRCAGPVPTSAERAGSTSVRPRERERQPGSGGRHQQVGGPAGWGQSAVSTGPATTAARRARRRRASGRRPRVPVEEEVGAPGQPVPPPPPSPAPLSAGAATNTAGSPVTGARGERDMFHGGEALVGRRRLELAERAHLRGRREQARLAPRQLPELLGVGSAPKRSSSRSTRLTCACASGVSARRTRRAPCRPAASITCSARRG